MTCKMKAIMQRMYAHINAFAEFLDQKGYDGHFASSLGFFGKIKENLTKHVFQCFEEKRSIEPLSLSTFTHWEHEDRPYVRCDFQTSFSASSGFKISKLKIEYGNSYGMVKQKDLSIHYPSEVPDRQEANRMILDQKRTVKL